VSVFPLGGGGGTIRLRARGWGNQFGRLDRKPGSCILCGSVSDPYSFFTDPDSDPEVEAGYQYGSGSNPDPGL
jgi:hypothetical protein